jgi:hypothetical protein
MIMRKLFGLICLCLPLLSMASPRPTLCPSPAEIKLVPGEYEWIIEDIRFEGYFVSPKVGSGLSTHIKEFTQARWMQFTNLADSLGVIECDYAGNQGGDVIRVVQGQEQTSPRPHGSHWNCAFDPVLPSTQCTCSGNLNQCAF